MTLAGLLSALTGWAFTRPAPAASPPPPAPPESTPAAKRKRRISASAISNARRATRQPAQPVPQPHPFRMPKPPPGVVPESERIAQDNAMGDLYGFASGAYLGNTSIGLSAGTGFFGFAMLADLSQRAEFRHISETIAREMTRKWITFESKSTDRDDMTDKLSALTDAFKAFKMQELFTKIALHDGQFGRAHLFIDTGDSDDRDEMATPLFEHGAKIAKGSIKSFRTVEPIWVYPNKYNSSKPLQPDFYHPTSWFVMGDTIHATRLLTFVGHEVPDILKPAYSFAGLSMTQMAFSYVENWLRTRQSVSDLIHNFSVRGIKTDLSDDLEGGDGEETRKRAEFFNALADNSGLFMLAKGNGADDPGEEFFNVAVPLGSLDKLQAQAQEQMCSIAAIPLIKLLGLTPSGLNATTDGEIRVWYDTVASFQAHLFKPNLDRLVQIVQLNEWGEIDPDITYRFEPLWQLDDVQLATKRKTDMDTDVAAVGAGILHPEDSRKRIAADPGSPYASLDVEDVPTPPAAADPNAVPGQEGGSDPGGEFPSGGPKPANDPGAARGGAPETARVGDRFAADDAEGDDGQDPFAADAGEFEESKHPRDEGGKFGSGGGGAAASHLPTKSEGGKRTTASGAPLPAHIAALKLPPAWTDVTYAADPKAPLQATGRDAKGRRQSVYSAEFSISQAAAKFARVAHMADEFKSILGENDKARASGNPAKREAADCFSLILAMGIRPGSESDTGAEKKAYGATTLRGDHVVTDGDQTFLRFTGKKGVALNLPVEDAETARMLRERASAAGPGGQLFPTISDKKLLAYVHTLDQGMFKTKDARTLLATTTAMDQVKAMPPPKDAAAMKKAQIAVAKVVARKLGNTPAIALQSYISPAVFDLWRADAHAE